MTITLVTVSVLVYDHDVVVLFQAYLVYKYRGKNNEVQHTTMMSKGGGSRHMYGNNKPVMNTDTITSNVNSTFDRYAEKSNTEESESLLEKDIQVRT